MEMAIAVGKNHVSRNHETGEVRAGLKIRREEFRTVKELEPDDRRTPL
jgi:hypothetical protein